MAFHRGQRVEGRSFVKLAVPDGELVYTSMSFLLAEERSSVCVNKESRRIFPRRDNQHTEITLFVKQNWQQPNNVRLFPITLCTARLSSKPHLGPAVLM